MGDRQITEDRFGRAILIRAVEQRLLGLYAEGQLHGTLHTCVGQEFTAVAVAEALEPGDTVVSNHRCHGHFIARTDDVDGLVAEVMGRASGVCGGRGGSQHLCAEGFLSNGIVGGMTPVAAGMAMARSLRGGSSIVVLFVGDGAMAQGAVFEGLNAAAIFGLPLYILCEDNGVAQSTDTAQVQAGTIAGRAEAFGIPAIASDTWNVDGLFVDVTQAVERVRRERRPLLHAVRTFRLNAHSKGDDIRPAEMLEEYRRRDPVADFTSTDLRRAADERVEKAVVGALASLETQIPRPADPWKPVTWRPAPLPEGTLVGRIRAGLDAALEGDERVVLLGEDISSPYGGAFKATDGLSDRYPGRVRNMPISEAGIVGLGTGLAIEGLHPIVEIMFGDFLTLGFDQLINHAAKFRFMYDDRVQVPLVVRTPMGGRRGYGPTHSQSLEKHFLGVPGLAVVALHHRADAEGFYRDLVGRITDPHLIVENKIAYGLDGVRDVPGGFACLESDEAFPTLWLRPPAPAALTILCHGGMLAEVERALDRLFEEYDVIAECLCPMALHPFNPAPLAEAVAASRRLLVVEEGYGFCGFGAEVIATMQEHLDGGFRASRLAAAGHPIPAARAAEAAHLPDAGRIVAKARELLR